MRNTPRALNAGLALCALVSLAACNDIPTPTAAGSIAPRTRRPESATLPTTSSHDARSILQILEETIDRDAGRFASSPGSRSWTVRPDGAASMKSASELQQVFGRQGAAQRLATLGLLADMDSQLSIRAYAIVQPYQNHLHFISTSVVNRTDQVFHSMVGTRSVAALRPGYGAIELFRTTDSVGFSASGGIASHAWDEFKATGGCSYVGTLYTRNYAHWPNNGYVPKVIVSSARDQAGGTGDLIRTCTPPAGAPPPSSSEPLCDDDLAGNCPSVSPGGATGGSGGEYAGPPVTRDMGYSGKWKLVCEVTDWYENGVFVETVVNRCWKELM